MFDFFIFFFVYKTKLTTHRRGVGLRVTTPKSYHVVQKVIGTQKKI